MIGKTQTNDKSSNHPKKKILEDDIGKKLENWGVYFIVSGWLGMIGFLVLYLQSGSVYPYDSNPIYLGLAIAALIQGYFIKALLSAISRILTYLKGIYLRIGNK